MLLTELLVTPRFVLFRGVVCEAFLLLLCFFCTAGSLFCGDIFVKKLRFFLVCLCVCFFYIYVVVTVVVVYGVIGPQQACFGREEPLVDRVGATRHNVARTWQGM